MNKLTKVLPQGRHAGETMNCLNCIHLYKSEANPHICSLWEGKPIPWDFVFVGCDEWASRQIIHNRDAAIVKCDHCKVDYILEPRGVLPRHNVNGYLTDPCPGALTNQYTVTGRRIVKEKRSAD